MPRSRYQLVCGMALLLFLTVTCGVSWAQSTSGSSPNAAITSLRSPKTILLAQASARESLPLGPTAPQSPTNPTAPASPRGIAPKEQSTSKDPFKQLIQQLAQKDKQAQDEQDKVRASAHAVSQNSESKPLPVYKPAQSTLTQNEIRDKELLLANPSERKALGTPGQALVPDTADPNEDKTLGTYSTTGNWILNTITALGVVIGLILLMRLGINKATGRSLIGGRNGAVTVLSRTSISPRNQVMLLRMGHRILVVSEGSNGMNTLADVVDPDEVAQLLATVSANQPGSITQSFNQLLNRAGSEMDDPKNFVQEHGGDEDEHAIDRTRDELSSLLSKIKSMSNKGGPQ